MYTYVYKCNVCMQTEMNVIRAGHVNISPFRFSSQVGKNQIQSHFLLLEYP